MRINEQALLNATLTTVVLSDQLGFKVPPVLRVVSVLALVVSLAYSVKEIAAPNSSTEQ